MCDTVRGGLAHLVLVQSQMRKRPSQNTVVRVVFRAEELVFGK
jgi:hypothetical protein